MKPHHAIRPRRRRRPRYANLRAYLAATGDTQAAIAEALDISQAQVSRIVAGLSVPRDDLAIRLADYADIPLESFILEAAGRKSAVA